MDKKFTLSTFETEEGNAALAKLTTFLNENDMDIRVQSSIGEDNKLEVKNILLKKTLIEPVVEVIPPTSETPIEAPIVDAPTVDSAIAQPE